jgi:hypothetical protein
MSGERFCHLQDNSLLHNDDELTDQDQALK